MSGRDDEQPQAELAAIYGSRGGERFRLERRQITVGRGTDNDVVIPDLAVSRRHLKLVHGERGWSFVDLGSGNGTRVNGRATDRCRLRDGDQIEIGNSVLELLTTDREPGRVLYEPAGALQEAPDDEDEDEEGGERRTTTPLPIAQRPTRAFHHSIYRRPPSSARLVALAAAGATVVLAVGLGTYQWLRVSDSPATASHQQALSAYRTAAALFRGGEWEPALREFRRAAERDPGLMDAQRAVEEIERYQDLFRKGLDLAGAQRKEGARALLSRIPRGAAFHPEALHALDALGPPDLPEASPQPTVAALGRRAKQPITESTTVTGGVSEALRLYRAAKFVDAARLLHAQAAAGDDRAAHLAEAVQEFSESYAKGREGLTKGRVEQAVASLERALELDQILGSAYRSALGRQLSAAQAQRAEEQLRAGRLVAAAESVTRALGYDHAHPGATKLAGRLLQKGRDLTIEAVRLRDRSPVRSRELLQTVTRITPQRSDVHRRATNLLDKLPD